MELIKIGQDGKLPVELQTDEHLERVLLMTAQNYANVGYQEPWIGYVAVENRSVIGFCGFKRPPEDGRVEIAYGTMPGLEGRGIATAMAKRLVEIASSNPDRPDVFAQTLPETNASTTILTKLGFEQTGDVEHPEDGTVWGWQLPRDS